MAHHLAIAELPNAERPRERMRDKGPGALSVKELLALVLRHGTREKSALELAEELYSRFGGTLSGLSGATVASLSELPGIGPTKAMELQAIFELARRMAEEAVLRQRPCLANPKLIVQYMSGRFRHPGQEEFHVLFMDSKLFLVRDEIVTIGLLDRCPIHPREIFRLAVQEGCSGIVVCHNHPSGDPAPSREDRESTRQLAMAGNVLGIRLLDHLVIGESAGNDPPYYSFRKNGEIEDAIPLEKKGTIDHAKQEKHPG